MDITGAQLFVKALHEGVFDTRHALYVGNLGIPDLNIRKGPGTDYSKTEKYTGIGTFTIVEEADGEGASKWGLLKSYQSGRNG